MDNFTENRPNFVIIYAFPPVSLLKYKKKSHLRRDLFILGTCSPIFKEMKEKYKYIYINLNIYIDLLTPPLDFLIALPWLKSCGRAWVRHTTALYRKVQLLKN